MRGKCRGVSLDIKNTVERETERRSLTKYFVTRVNRCKYRDGLNSLRDDIASRRAAKPTCRGIGSCEAGLTPATLPAEPSRGPTTGMPCVKMPSCQCAQIVCAPRAACACVRARCRMRKTCVCAPSLSLFPPIVPTLLFPLAACVPRAQHHLSSLSHLSPGPILSSPLLLVPLDLWKFFFSLPFFVSFILDFLPRFPDYIKKKKDRKYILVSAPHGSPRGLAFKSRVPLGEGF